MFDSNILDVMIGVVFVFLLLSVATSWFTELVAQIFRLRAHHLKKYLVEWLDAGAADSFVNKLYESKVISALYKKGQWRAGPSFISPKDFVSGLVEAALTTDAGIVADTQADMAAYIQENLPETIQYPIIAFMNDLTRPVTEAEAQLVDLRKDLEEWFNSAMDRCIGFYKRKVYWVGLVGAIFFAVFANIDTVAVARALWDNQDVRLEVANTAIDYIDTVSLPEEGAGDPLEEAGAAMENIEETLADMQELELPLFWETGPMVGEDQYNQNLNHVLDDPSLWLPKFLGIAMTALAASFGSPIWFDLLKQLVNLRSTGPKPGEKTSANKK